MNGTNNHHMVASRKMACFHDKWCALSERDGSTKVVRYCVPHLYELYSGLFH